MAFFQLFLLVASLVVGLAASSIIIISSSTEDYGLASGSSGKFMPGSFDSSRNKLLAIMCIIVAGSIVLINAIEMRKERVTSSSQYVSEKDLKSEVSVGNAESKLENKKAGEPHGYED